jgi:hypothetical protein
MNRLFVPMMLGLLLTASLSCTQTVAGAPNPLAAVQQQVQPGDNFHVLGVRQLPNNQAVVFFVETQPPQPNTSPTEMIGYHLVSKDRVGRWFVRGSGGYSYAHEPGSTERLVYGEGSIPDDNGQLSQFLYGQRLSDQATAIEVTLTNGETQREEIDDSIFIMLLPVGIRYCEVRIIGQENKVLQRDTIHIITNPPSDQNCPN